jgi:hypothetical protein
VELGAQHRHSLRSPAGKRRAKQEVEEGGEAVVAKLVPEVVVAVLGDQTSFQRTAASLRSCVPRTIPKSIWNSGSLQQACGMESSRSSAMVPGEDRFRALIRRCPKRYDSVTRPQDMTPVIEGVVDSLWATPKRLSILRIERSTK